MKWINFYGIAIMAVILIPNIVLPQRTKTDLKIFIGIK